MESTSVLMKKFTSIYLEESNEAISLGVICSN